MRFRVTSTGLMMVAAAAGSAAISMGTAVHAATIVAQDQNAFFGAPTFATPGAVKVAGFVGAPQNGIYTGQSRANLTNTIGEAFTVASPTNLTDFELNEFGGPGTPAGGNVNFTITFGTLTTATNVFTPVSTETATAVATASVNNGQPANTFEDFKLSTPIAVVASPAGTEYGFIIGDNLVQDSLDRAAHGDFSGPNMFNTTSQGYAGANTTVAGTESINNGVGTPGTALNFVVGGTPFSVATPEPASLGLLAIGGLGLFARRRRSL